MGAVANLSPSDTGDVCVICLSSITERATTSCNHSAFDFICLVSWLQTRSTCPLCKAEVTAVTYQHTSPSDFKTYHVRRTHAATTLHDNSSDLLPERPVRRPRFRYRAFSPPRADAAVLRRRYVYQHKLYSLYVGTNARSGYRNITPQVFASSPDLQSRARTWIRRELRVFRFLYNDTSSSAAAAPTTSNNAEFLLTYIVSMLKKLDIRDSEGRAEDLLSEFLGRDHARLFLHELNAWLRSPYEKVEEWDRLVQYEEPLPTSFDSEGHPVWDFEKEESDVEIGPSRRHCTEDSSSHEPG